MYLVQLSIKDDVAGMKEQQKQIRLQEADKLSNPHTTPWQPLPDSDNDDNDDQLIVLNYQTNIHVPSYD